MTDNQILNCAVFSDKEIVDARYAHVKRLETLTIELAIMNLAQDKNVVVIHHCEQSIQSCKDFISNMDEILNYRNNEKQKKGDKLSFS